jgi:hypothetical protein
VSDTDSSTTDGQDDHFAARVQAEVLAAAERRRREDVNIARVEREVERAWAHVAPPGAAGPAQELLLDRVDRLSLIDVDAPIGTKPGVKHIKGAIRKATYWYLRYMSDQLNALHNVYARLLRRTDERLAGVEAAVGIDERIGALVAPAPAPSAAIGTVVASALGDVNGPVMVSACGDGAGVLALQSAGVAVYGVDADPSAVLAGIDEGADLRVGDGNVELAQVEHGALAAVVIGGSLQRQSLSALLGVLERACAAVGSGGTVVIVPEALADRSPVDSELLAGRGLSAAAWEVVCRGLNLAVEQHAHGEPGVDAIVVARCP